LVIVLFILFRKSGKIKLNLNLKTIKQTLRLSFPFALLAILMMFYTRVDAVMIERMLPNGQEQAGIYAQAFRISDTLSMFAVLFASILLPLFAKMIKDKVQIGDTLSHSFALLMVPVIAIIFPVIFSAPEFMKLLYHQHSQESAKVLYFLMIGFAGICLSYIFGTLLTSAGKLFILNKIAAFGLVLNIVLNLILIPQFGAVGAAIVSSATQLLIGIIQAIISIHTLKIKVKMITPIKYLGLMISSIFLTIILKPFISWYLVVFIVASSVCILGLIFKLIQIENLKQALK
jgi:O-antigen/teichoic acid export membrane protein